MFVQSSKLRKKRAKADASRLAAEADADEGAREHSALLTRLHEAELSAYAGRILVCRSPIPTALCTAQS